jgi:DNA-binding transcriptional ArsR family regulator
MTAGEIAAHFDIAKPTLSAHFAVLREADLVESEKVGTSITYSLKLSVLEDALLSFAETVGVGRARPGPRSAGRLRLATRRGK